MTALNKQALRSREEFEEYYNETHAVKVTSQFKRFGYYVSPTMQKAWELWQKAQSSMLDELEAAEKRIAELELREVVLPQCYSMLHRVDFDEPYHTEMVYRQHQVLEALHNAGINVTEACKGEAS